MNPFQSYRDQIAKMPAVESIEKDAAAMFPDQPSNAAIYAGGMFRGYYFFCRDLLERVLDRIEAEEKLRRGDVSAAIARNIRSVDLFPADPEAVFPAALNVPSADLSPTMPERK